MIEFLRAAASRDDAQPAVITKDRTVSYGRLCADAEGVATALGARGITRFGIVEQDAATVIALLAGASLAGAQACVYPPLDVPGVLPATVARLGHDVVVSDDDLQGHVQVVAPADLVASSRATGALPDRRPLLVLTTGTTGEPKAARHDWWRIARGARHIVATPGHRWLLAHGLHQFGGLQVLVHVLAAGATLVAPAPRRPPDGLAAMRAHGVTHASATPTFWRFLLALMRADGGPVPALRQITLGAEPVPQDVLDDLRATFPGAAVSQIYGITEVGCARSVRDGRAGLPLGVLASGDEADVQLRIIDGELWTRSRIGMLGYDGEPEIDPEAWRPTGDLVHVDNDRVVFRGRTSALISVGSIKVHPAPVEDHITPLPGVAAARVHGRPNAMTGSIVAVEVVIARGADPDDVVARIREACADLPAAARPRSIRIVERLGAIEPRRP